MPGVTTKRGSAVASSGNFQRIQEAARTFFFYKQTVFYFLEYNYKHTCSNCGIFHKQAINSQLGDPSSILSKQTHQLITMVQNSILITLQTPIREGVPFLTSFVLQQIETQLQYFRGKVPISEAFPTPGRNKSNERCQHANSV